MPWIAAELSVDASVVTAFADALLEQGAISIDVTDARSGCDDEQPMFMEPEAGAMLGWEDNRIVALFDNDADVKQALEAGAVAAGLGGVPAHRIYPVTDQDWVRLTQQQFNPIAVSQRLWIVPSWHTSPTASAIQIVMDPGLAFGTGSHPTTYLCLDWLDLHLRPGQSVIDYGCGSGILAIAAAKLGASVVTGVDIDDQALQASRYNARQNDVQARFVAATVTDIGVADVVIANILSGPLKVLAPLLAGLTRSGGCLVLSGILEAQANELMTIYQDWFEMLPPVNREGWVRLEGIRRTG
ncbi:MAG: 50S ribosomal protein L11 methyltransferase [Burkholderiales bacterium]|nr:50S ribosomal protein L11 methyltransferase [Burkholderiales bacterium]